MVPGVQKHYGRSCTEKGRTPSWQSQTHAHHGSHVGVEGLTHFGVLPHHVTGIVALLWLLLATATAAGTINL